MGIKLYVGNLNYATREEELRTLFSEVGTVVSVELIKDRETGSSKGFAFVEMGDQEEADKAISAYNGYSLGNRQIKVSIARPREERPQGGWYSDKPYKGYNSTNKPRKKPTTRRY